MRPSLLRQPPSSRTTAPAQLVPWPVEVISSPGAVAGIDQMLFAVPQSAQKKVIRPGWPPIRAMVATCCVVEPMHGAPCATITPKMKVNAAAVTIQLMMFSSPLPVRLRTLGRPMLILAVVPQDHEPVAARRCAFVSAWQQDAQ
jgi:hypothetical protein